MKTIQIEVPDHRCVSQWWLDCSPERMADVLEGIAPIVMRENEGDAASKLEIQLLRQRLAGVSDVTNAAAKAVEEHLETVWTRRIKEKDQLIEMLQVQCDSFKTVAEQAKKACEAQQHMATCLRQQHAAPQFTAQQAGSMAETEIEQLIAETLACEVQDVSHETGRGDRLVTTPDGLQLMVEIKNTERLHSKHDIEKFKRDAYEGASHQKINAALLISLKSNSIPNVGGGCTVTFITTEQGRMPMVMLASNSRIAIQLSLRAIAELRNVCDKELRARGGAVPVQLDVLEAERALVQKTLPKLLQFVRETDHRIETRIEMLQQLLDDALNERACARDTSYHCTKMQQNISWLDLSLADSDHDMAVGVVLKWFERKGEFPKSSEMTMSQRAVVKNAGGIKTVVEAARKKQRVPTTSKPPDPPSAS